MPNFPQTYDRTTISLHWFTAACVALLWVIGQTADWISDGRVNTAYWSFHVVLGLVLTVVLLFRMAWRATAGRGLPAADAGAAPRASTGSRAAKAEHRRSGIVGPLRRRLLGTLAIHGPGVGEPPVNI